MTILALGVQEGEIARIGGKNKVIIVLPLLAEVSWEQRVHVLPNHEFIIDELFTLSLVVWLELGFDEEH